MTTKPESTTEETLEPCSCICHQLITRCARCSGTPCRDGRIGDSSEMILREDAVHVAMSHDRTHGSGYRCYEGEAIAEKIAKLPPASTAPVVDSFEAWIKNYWPDWQKAEQGTIELMRAAWNAATRLAKFNDLALKGAIDYTVELESKLAATTEQSDQLTNLQRAMIEHDDDMARLDRNTAAAATAAPEQSDKYAEISCAGCGRDTDTKLLLCPTCVDSGHEEAR